MYHLGMIGACTDSAVCLCTHAAELSSSKGRVALLMVQICLLHRVVPLATATPVPGGDGEESSEHDCRLWYMNRTF